MKKGMATVIKLDGTNVNVALYWVEYYYTNPIGVTNCSHRQLLDFEVFIDYDDE